jgi:hypothetical protein
MVIFGAIFGPGVSLAEGLIASRVGFDKGQYEG